MATELNLQTALQFLVNKLKINPEGKNITSHKFLNEVIRAFQSEIPFQNISLNAVDEADRVPTLKVVLDAGLSGKGGVCVHNNYFMYLLLKALGYKVFVVAGMYSDAAVPDNHVIVIVEDLENVGDLHLVDVGCGYPTLRTVPLLKLPYSLTNAGLEIKYVKEDDVYVRMHRSGEPLPDPGIPMADGGWRKVFFFNLIPRDLPHFEPPMRELFCEDPKSHFQSHLRLYRCPAPGDHAVAIFDRLLLHYHENKPPEKSEIPDDKLEEEVLRHFPMLPKEEIVKSLAVFRRRSDWLESME